MSVTKERPKFLESLEPIAVDVIRPAAIAIDEGGMFPRQAMEALSKGGLLGLVSSTDVGGSGLGPRAELWHFAGVVATS